MCVFLIFVSIMNSVELRFSCLVSHTDQRSKSGNAWMFVSLLEQDINCQTSSSGDRGWYRKTTPKTQEDEPLSYLQKTNVWGFILVLICI